MTHMSHAVSQLFEVSEKAAGVSRQSPKTPLLDSRKFLSEISAAEMSGEKFGATISQSQNKRVFCGWLEMKRFQCRKVRNLLSRNEFKCSTGAHKNSIHKTCESSQTCFLLISLQLYF